MLIRVDSRAYRLLCALPLRLSPYLVIPARVGMRFDVLALVKWRWS